MHQLYVLFEHACGYALFRTTEFEEIALFLPQVRKSILDISKFRSIVFLKGFHLFQNGSEALANMNCIAKGELPLDLRLFLESNVPKSKKSTQSILLGVADQRLASSISDVLGIACSTSGTVCEVIRGIRHHFPKLIKGYKDQNTLIKSQQALSHQYARAKMDFDVKKSDCMVTETITMLDQLEKDITSLTLRVREWYSFHFPELIKIVPDTESYIKCVSAIGDRQQLSEDIEDTLQLLLQDSEKVQKILEANHSSMGMEIAEEDITNIESFIEQINSLIKRRDEMKEYLKLKMQKVAPNLSALIGEKVGARLISQAGSLNNLAKFPASTVQILGAEKSLFRSMKIKGKKVPKFGSLDQSSFIGKVGKTTQGRMARYLAHKCSLASRIDCFSKISSDKHGLCLKQLVEDRQKVLQMKASRITKVK